jgi:hypothetical protein
MLINIDSAVDCLLQARLTHQTVQPLTEFAPDLTLMPSCWGAR